MDERVVTNGCSASINVLSPGCAVVYVERDFDASSRAAAQTLGVASDYELV